MGAAVANRRKRRDTLKERLKFTSSQGEDWKAIKVLDEFLADDGSRRGKFANARRKRSERRVRDFGELFDDEYGEQLYRCLTYHPDLAVPRVAQKAGGHWWAVLDDLYEACWRQVTSRSVGAAVPAGDQTGIAYLARTRWVLLSWPFRQRLGLATGTIRVSEPLEVASRARRARADWLAELDCIDDHPLLASHLNVEQEIRDLLRVRLDSTLLEKSSSTGHLDQGDIVVWRRCVRHHLLPRFAVPVAFRQAHQLLRRWRGGWVLCCSCLGCSFWRPSYSGSLAPSTLARVAGGRGTRSPGPA